MPAVRHPFPALPVPGRGSIAGLPLAVALCAASAAGGAAQGDRPQLAQAPSPPPAPEAAGKPAHAGPALFEAPRDRAERLREELEGRVAQSLAWLPGVASARLHVSLTRRAALDAPAEPARAVAVLRLVPGEPDATLSDQARRLVAHAVPGLEEQRVEVLIVDGPPQANGAPAPAPVESVGPFTVRADQAGALRGTLAALLALNGVLAGALLVLWRRRKGP